MIEKNKTKLPDSTITDEALVRQAVEGCSEAIDTLIRRHQKWIFNLTLHMLWNRDDAADCTQEILLRMVTHLSTFQENAAFKTWLYRISTNHVLMWKRKSSAENAITGFDCYRQCLENFPESTPGDSSPEHACLVEEASIGCTLGMLLCLSREQRLVYILGEILEIDERTSAEVLELSTHNFRQRLHRSRTQLHGFLSGQCGLVNPDNPCRCARKTDAFIAGGIVNPQKLQFVTEAVHKARASAATGSTLLTALTSTGIGQLYRNHPNYEPPDMVVSLRTLIGDSRFRKLMQL